VPGPEPTPSPEGVTTPSPAGGTGENGADQGQPGAGGTTEPPSPPVQTSAKRQFYGNIELDPVKAKLDFATIVDEVVQQFTAKLGVEVSISVEIRVIVKSGVWQLDQATF